MDLVEILEIIVKSPHFLYFLKIYLHVIKYYSRTKLEKSHHKEIVRSDSVDHKNLNVRKM